MHSNNNNTTVGILILGARRVPFCCADFKVSDLKEKVSERKREWFLPASGAFFMDIVTFVFHSSSLFALSHRYTQWQPGSNDLLWRMNDDNVPFLPRGELTQWAGCSYAYISSEWVSELSMNTRAHHRKRPEKEIRVSEWERTLYQRLKRDNNNIVQKEWW